MSSREVNWQKCVLSLIFPMPRMRRQRSESFTALRSSRWSLARRCESTVSCSSRSAQTGQSRSGNKINKNHRGHHNHTFFSLQMKNKLEPLSRVTFSDNDKTLYSSKYLDRIGV